MVDQETLHPTTAGRFQAENSPGYGIKGQKAAYSPTVTGNNKRRALERVSSFVNTGSKTLSRTGRSINKTGLVTQQNEDGFSDDVRKAGSNISMTGKKGSALASKLNSVETTIKASTVSIAVASWTIFLWFWVLTPLSVASLIAYGATYYLTDSWISTLAAAAYNVTLGWWWSTPVSTQDIWIIFFLVLFLQITCSLTIHIGALIHYKLAGLNSLFGKASSLKTSFFLLSLIMSIFPGAAIIPWIWFWEVSVEVYPN